MSARKERNTRNPRHQPPSPPGPAYTPRDPPSEEAYRILRDHPLPLQHLSREERVFVASQLKDIIDLLHQYHRIEPFKMAEMILACPYYISRAARDVHGFGDLEELSQHADIRQRRYPGTQREQEAAAYYGFQNMHTAYSQQSVNRAQSIRGGPHPMPLYGGKDPDTISFDVPNMKKLLQLMRDTLLA